MRTTKANASALIQDWPEESREAAQLVIDVGEGMISRAVTAVGYNAAAYSAPGEPPGG